MILHARLSTYVQDGMPDIFLERLDSNKVQRAFGPAVQQLLAAYDTPVGRKRHVPGKERSS